MGNQQFKSAQDALIFAFRFSGQVYERPMMNRMADDPVRYAGEQAQLHGLDGAGQAAMIWNRVALLSDMHQFVLYAAYGPRQTPCSCGHACCSGWARNPFWEACIVKIEEAAITKALAGCLTNRRLRRGIVKGLFGDKSVSLPDLAHQCEVAENTAASHRQRIKHWLNGTREDGHTAGVRPRAERCIEQLLADAGILEMEVA
jgi:hypothetical protein